MITCASEFSGFKLLFFGIFEVLVSALSEFLIFNQTYGRTKATCGHIEDAWANGMSRL